MRMISGTLLGFKNEDIRFTIESDQRIRLIHPSTSFTTNFSSFSPTEFFEIVNGKTNDGRNISFINVKYKEDHPFMSAEGWVISTHNVTPDSLESFDALSFSGKAIDAFYSPRKAFAYDAIDPRKRFDYSKQFPTLSVRPYSDFSKDFDVSVDGEVFSVKLSMAINYTREEDTDRSIGTVVPKMIFNFSTPKPLKDLSRYYLHAYDFLSFISFRRCIVFDKITLHTVVPNGPQHGKLNTIATAFFLSPYSETDYTSTERDIITYDDIISSIGSLFSAISKRRTEEKAILNHFFIPKTNREYSQVDPIVFLSCALSFEGEYNQLAIQRNSPNESVTDIQHETISFLSQLSCKYQNNTNLDSKTRGKAKRLVKKYISIIQNTDTSLDDKFNSVYKEYNQILQEYLKRILPRFHINYSSKLKYGGHFASMRNKIAHGSPSRLKPEHIIAYQLARCMIYIMILDSSDVPHSAIETIIMKLFL